MTGEAAERLSALCVEFRLPTLATELVQRLIAAGHDTLIPLVAEIFELEAGDRRERRVERLLRASKLPPGKTFCRHRRARVPDPPASPGSRDPPGGVRTVFRLDGAAAARA